MHESDILASSLPSADSCSLEGTNVLVVDDHDGLRYLMMRVLQKHGANVRTEESVDKALTAIEEFEPDVIISDISMPGKTGYDLVRTLRNDIEAHKEDKTPAIAVSAYTDSTSQRKSLSEGFQVHLGKPFNSKFLVQLVAVLAEMDGEAVRNGFDPSSIVK